ncbi:MAG: HipA domain-containing protein, partial [Ignavibacteriae bacterium]|nr:HipA domain-containing protein [Ignavibacteriota bacterium]
MRRCPITYEELIAGEYSSRGLRMLARQLTRLEPLPFTAEEQRLEAVRRAAKMSIQGVQAKLSARLNVNDGCFDVVDVGGQFILKPQSNLYLELPENEDVTMRLAADVGIEVPFHGMVYSKDGSLTYFIRRFDRVGRRGKLPVEDFAQLQGKTRDTKYQSSMEQIAATIETHCTFPAVEKLKLFRLTLFSFLVGNEDMHVKNFSLISRGGKVELSPGYDLLNTTIALGGTPEELALPLRGKKRNLDRRDLIDYFGFERLGLTRKSVDSVLKEFARAVESWRSVLAISFLSEPMKQSYLA